MRLGGDTGVTLSRGGGALVATCMATPPTRVLRVAPGAAPCGHRVSRRWRGAAIRVTRRGGGVGMQGDAAHACHTHPHVTTAPHTLHAAARRGHTRVAWSHRGQRRGFAWGRVTHTHVSRPHASQGAAQRGHGVTRVTWSSQLWLKGHACATPRCVWGHTRPTRVPHVSTCLTWSSPTCPWLHTRGTRASPAWPGGVTRVPPWCHTPQPSTPVCQHTTHACVTCVSPPQVTRPP